GKARYRRYAAHGDDDLRSEMNSVLYHTHDRLESGFVPYTESGARKPVRVVQPAHIAAPLAECLAAQVESGFPLVLSNLSYLHANHLLSAQTSPQAGAHLQLSGTIPPKLGARGRDAL